MAVRLSHQFYLLILFPWHCQERGSLIKGDVLFNTPLLATRKDVQAQIKVDKVVASSVLSIIQFSATVGKVWLLRSTKWLFPTCCCC